MTHRRVSFGALGCAVALALGTAAWPVAAEPTTTPAPFRLISSRVSLAGTSNIHAYTASSDAARLGRVQVAPGALGGDLWTKLLEPGALEAFEIALPAATLSSPKDGLDKNMHKALKVAEHPEITFRLSRLEATAAGALRGIGVLKIAGVEREVALDLETQRSDATLTVVGEVKLLMTDLGITPPKAMLGMLKTDPKVTVTFEMVLGIPLT